MLKIIYLGTPEFAVPCLQALLEDKDSYEVLAVVAQPDRPKGRGNKLTAPPTKVLAEAHGIPVFQPEKLAKAPEIVQAMRDLKPDLLVMVAFGQILKQEVLDLAPHGVINVHGSLLPKLRGAAPINWSIINGDTTTGVTTMFTELGVDTGPMLLKAEIQISPDMTAEELSQEMSKVGAKTLIATLRELQAGTLVAHKQDDAAVTFAPILSKEMGKLDFSKSAETIHNLVRGLKPWPGTYTRFRGKGLKILQTKLCPKETSLPQTKGKADGTLFVSDKHLYVVCAGEALEILSLQPESRAAQTAQAFLTGAHLTEEDRLG